MKKINYLLVVFLLSSMGSAMANTVTKTASQIGTYYGWTSKSIYRTFALNSVITISALECTGTSQNGYYSADSPIDWRLYQARNNGRFDIIARSGWVITAVNFTYGYKSSSEPSKLVDEDGKVYYSEQTVQVDGLDTLRLHVENAGEATGTQARISRFSITYAYRDSSMLVETFSQVEQPKNASSETSWTGDVAQWKVKNVRRANADTLNNHILGSWSKSSGYIQSTNLEGGIKALRFNWRQWGGVHNGAMLQVAVQAGDVKDTVSTPGLSDLSKIPTMTFDTLLQCKENQQLCIKNITKTTSDANDRIVFDNIHIVPYLLFRSEKQNQTLDLAYTDKYDLTEALINNTDGEGQVVYSIEVDETGAVVLMDSLLDFSQVRSDGQVLVKAYWNDSLVSTQLRLNVKAIVFEGEALVETFSNCSYQSSTSVTYVEGDNGFYDWNMTNFRRSAADTIGDLQATLLNYGGAIYSNGEQEGGIQCLKIDYRAQETNLPISFTVMVNTNLYTCTQPVLGSDTVFQYKQVASVKKNSSLTISLAKNSQNKAHVLISKVSIAPYIMFTVPNRVDTVELGTSSYDLSEKLLDNTQGVDEIIYSIVNDETQQAALSGSALDLSGVTVSGKIKVMATWGSVTTTMSVFVKEPVSGLSSISRSELPKKQLVNGHVRIVRGERVYTVVGTPVN